MESWSILTWNDRKCAWRQAENRFHCQSNDAYARYSIPSPTVVKSFLLRKCDRFLSWHHSKQISWLHFDPWVQERGTLRISPLSFTFSLKSREEETIYTSTLHRPFVNNINESTQLERTFLRAYFNVPLWLFGAFCPREWLKNFTFNTVELSKSAVSKCF